MRVVIGRIGRPHGIRGEVTVESRTDEPGSRFAAGSVVQAGERDLAIERSAWKGKCLVIKFAGVDDRNTAESLLGALIEIDRVPGELPAHPDEFYDTDLVGLDAVTGDGRFFGRVREVLHLPGQDVLAIDRDGREILLPFIEEFVPDVDLASRRLTVAPPEGLEDL
jgi:16S rRNA processing protein RimM